MTVLGIGEIIVSWFNLVTLVSNDVGFAFAFTVSTGGADGSFGITIAGFAVRVPMEIIVTLIAAGKSEESSHAGIAFVASDMSFARTDSIFVTGIVQSSVLAAFTRLALGVPEKSGSALVTFIADNVLFARTFSSCVITILVHGTIGITFALLGIGEIVVSWITLVALVSSDVWLTSTFSILVALGGHRSIRITFTSFALGKAIVISSAFVTSGELNVSISAFIAFLAFHMIIARALAIVITGIVHGSVSVTHASIASRKSIVFSSALGTLVSNHVVFATTFTTAIIASQGFGSLSVTFARFGIGKVIVLILTLVTFQASDQVRFAFALTRSFVTNETRRSFLVTLAFMTIRKAVMSSSTSVAFVSFNVTLAVTFSRFGIASQIL